MSVSGICRYREYAPERAQEFAAKGYRPGDYFPHRIYYLPKGGPDGFKLATRMVGRCHPHQLREVVLYALRPTIDEFPAELFFDDDLIWHRQHFGKIGQIATADLVLQGPRLYSMAHTSDLVQRISRRRAHKTRIESVFHGWSYMLLHAILNFAVEHACSTIHIATADFAHQHTDHARKVGRELFERIYDTHVCRLFTVARRGPWWVVDVRENQHLRVRPAMGCETQRRGRTICLCHDVEMGWGHRDVDPELARLADARARPSLHRMLEHEAKAHAQATYNVLGVLMPEVMSTIRQRGHAVAFHSYDHHVDTRSRVRRALAGLFRRRADVPTQLGRCRDVDYRIRGYRPPQSVISEEMSDHNLCFHNFEWLASATSSLRRSMPQMDNGLVKIPIAFDDFDMYRDHVHYEDWEAGALDRIRRSDFVAFSLHDCYAHLWLPRYEGFLAKICELGELRTLDAVADDVILASAV